MPSTLLQTADTLVMLQARDGLGTAAAVAQLVLAAAFVLVLLALVALLFQLRGIGRSVRALGDRLERRVEPLIDRSKEIAANAEFISAAVRTDVQRVSRSVRSLSDRLQGASDRMEQRVEEFNALMEVIQSEAEDLFIGTAASVRGVRAGARALREDRPDGADRADDTLLDAEDAALAGEAGLAPRELGPAALEARTAPGAAPGGVQVTGRGERAAGRADGG